MRTCAGGEPLSGENLGSGASVPSNLHVQNSPLYIHYPRLPHHMLTMGNAKTSVLLFYLVVHIPSGSIRLLDSPKPGSPFRDGAKMLWKSITCTYVHPHGVGGSGGLFPVGFGVASCRCCSDFSLLPCLLQLRSRDPGEPQGNRSRPPRARGRLVCSQPNWKFHGGAVRVCGEAPPPPPAR